MYSNIQEADCPVYEIKMQPLTCTECGRIPWWMLHEKYLNDWAIHPELYPNLNPNRVYDGSNPRDCQLCPVTRNKTPEEWWLTIGILDELS